MWMFPSTTGTCFQLGAVPGNISDCNVYGDPFQKDDLIRSKFDKQEKLLPGEAAFFCVLVGSFGFGSGLTGTNP